MDSSLRSSMRSSFERRSVKIAAAPPPGGTTTASVNTKTESCELDFFLANLTPQVAAARRHWLDQPPSKSRASLEPAAVSKAAQRPSPTPTQGDPQLEDYDSGDSVSESGSLSSNGSASITSQRSIKTKSRRPRLSKISSMYDLNGDGCLDEIEQAMRDRDVDNSGNLDNREVHAVIQDQLKNQSDVRLYKKVAAALTCLVAILSLSNFATGWASAILSKDTVADPESGTIQSKSSHEIIGINSVANEFDLESLTDEEFEERRLLVDAEMEEDPDHEYHVHRRLGKKNNKNSSTKTKVAYDHGKIREEDLMKLIRKCDGVNTVSIKRKWQDGDFDVDTICGPGTTVVEKGKMKSNKSKTKRRRVDQQVKLRRKFVSSNGGIRDGEVSFECSRGDCYASGQTLLQEEAHICELSRDRDGAGECDEGLVCYDPDGDNRGTGTCTRLAQYAPRNKICDLAYGVDACEDRYACFSSVKHGSRTEGVVNTGICQRLRKRSKNQDVCDTSFGSEACDEGYTCIGKNACNRNGQGMGYCQLLVTKQRNGGLCDLSYGEDACDDGHYCRDCMLARNAGGGGGGGDKNGVLGRIGSTSAIISGPSGIVVGVQERSVGTGTCTSTVGRGGQCGSHNECGTGSFCRGLGADTATGGVIRESGGTIVWGTGGATIGYCE